MKTVEELKEMYLICIDVLSKKIVAEINRLGGYTTASKKLGFTNGVLRYAVYNDNFKTKMRILKKLEDAK
jgi:hypothetical protein